MHTKPTKQEQDVRDLLMCFPLKRLAAIFRQWIRKILYSPRILFIFLQNKADLFIIILLEASKINKWINSMFLASFRLMLKFKNISRQDRLEVLNAIHPGWDGAWILHVSDD